ncbi:MAG: IclR family transcriptional regulator [Dichotomicrobium sp.]
MKKAFAILEVLAQGGRPVSAPDLAAQLGMTRQTIHRLIHQLEEMGMVRRDIERERFEIGPAFAELGLHALSTGHQSKLRRAVMEELVAKSGETCNLTVLDGHEIVYIDRVECNWPLRRQIEIGGRMPAYCTAGGKLLLALAPAKTLDQYLSTVTLKRLTPNTWTDPEAFRAHLETIRAQDYSINNQENLIGLLAVAVPVRDPSGRVLAALALHGPEARLRESRAQALVPEIRKAAGAIGELLVESTAPGLSGD